MLMALFQNKESLSSNKTTRVCGQADKNVQLQARPRGLIGVRRDFNLLLHPIVIRRLTIYRTNTIIPIITPAVLQIQSHISVIPRPVIPCNSSITALVAMPKTPVIITLLITETCIRLFLMLIQEIHIGMI